MKTCKELSQRVRFNTKIQGHYQKNQVFGCCTSIFVALGGKVSREIIMIQDGFSFVYKWCTAEITYFMKAMR